MKYIKLPELDDLLSLLNDLNSNWSVCRNSRSFIEGEPLEYWKRFDAAMGKVFELQMTLMKQKPGVPPGNPSVPEVSGRSTQVKA